jgi:hypothetical protein
MKLGTDFGGDGFDLAKINRPVAQGWCSDRDENDLGIGYPQAQACGEA